MKPESVESRVHREVEDVRRGLAMQGKVEEADRREAELVAALRLALEGQMYPADVEKTVEMCRPYFPRAVYVGEILRGAIDERAALLQVLRKLRRHSRTPSSRKQIDLILARIQHLMRSP